MIRLENPAQCHRGGTFMETDVFERLDVLTDHLTDLRGHL
jgi:hypothetical protein